MAKKRKKPLTRGPKGGKKHTPGRDHDRKTKPRKRKKFAAEAERRREELRQEAKRQWELWDSLNDVQLKPANQAGLEIAVSRQALTRDRRRRRAGRSYRR